MFYWQRHRPMGRPSFETRTAGVLTMTRRRVSLLLLVQGLIVLVVSAPARAGEDTPHPWNKAATARYLDGRAEDWFKFGSAYRGQGSTATSCVSCHSLLPYALARPVLRRLSNEKMPTKWETLILEQTKRRVSNWDQLDAAEFQLFYDFDDAKKKQSRGTEAVLNALLLVFDDCLEGRRQPSDDTKNALSILWATQITEGVHKGTWEWLNFGLEPWESTEARFLGASVAAIAIGTASANGLANTEGDSRERLDFLRNYLKKNYGAQNLHNRTWMLWASATMDGLLSSREKDQLVEQLFAKQQDSGGWSLASLGDFTHGKVKAAVTTPDGYATGLVLHVLQTAGLSKDTLQVSQGLSWLRSHQDPTGAWRATSVNKNREPESTNPAKAHLGKFMWDAATGYAVLALSH